MPHNHFDASMAEKLSDPGRLETLIPSVMWDAAAVDDPQAIVDIGAGTGLITWEFARLAPHAVVYAADTSEEMLEWMKQRIPEDVESRIVPLKSDDTRVPLPDAAADLVTMVALYHHLSDPRAVLSEAMRLLRGNGRLLVVDWKKKQTLRGPSLAIRVEPERIAQVVREVGFKEVEIPDVLSDFSVVTGTRAVS